MAELVAAEGLTAYTAWFYSPMFLPALQHLTPGLVVYDAMDELSLFQDAPAALLPRERQAPGAGGRGVHRGVSLGRAKAQRHPNVHPFPSGVEVEHYRQALAPQTVVPAPLARLPRPRAGFFGVLDERLDLALLAAVARPGAGAVRLAGAGGQDRPCPAPAGATCTTWGSRRTATCRPTSRV